MAKNILRQFRYRCILMVLLCPLALWGQSGRVYEFLNLPATARTTALGGYAAPTLDKELGNALYYPALLSQNLHNELSLNFADYFGDINFGTVAFARQFQRTGNMQFALKYISYGRFTETDETGQVLGSFSASEYAFTGGWGRSLNEHFSIGSNLSLISSVFENYSSLGIAVDVSVAYLNPGKHLASALVIKNIGRQLSTYQDGNRENLPLDVVIGVSKKLANAPLRFSFVAHNLQQLDLSYPDPISRPEPQNNLRQEKTAQERFDDFTDQLFRHLVVGMEFIPTRNFAFNLGYNYRRRQEMKVDTRLSTVGISWGMAVQVSHFKFQYGRSNYHLAGAPNHISVSTSLDRLFPKTQALLPEGL